MKKINFIFVILLNSILFSQPIYNVGFNYGYFPYHSENKLQIANSDKFTNIFGLSLSRKMLIKDKLYCDINIGINHTNSEGKLDISDYIFEDDSVYVLYNKSLSSTTEFICPLDINISTGPDLIYYGIGISLSGIRRKSIYKFYYDDNKTNIENFSDNLSLVGVGLNSFIRFSYPIFASNKYNLFTEGRIRYISKIFCLNKGLDLGDYKYNFTQIVVSIGVEL